MEAELHSTHPPLGGLTVTTHVNLERLHFLAGLCASWAGPMIAAAYLPLIPGRESDLDSALQTYKNTFYKCAEPRQQARSQVVNDAARVSFDEGIKLASPQHSMRTIVRRPPCTCQANLHRPGLGSSTDVGPKPGIRARLATYHAVSPAHNAPQPSLYAIGHEPVRQTAAFKNWYPHLAAQD